MKDKNVHDTSCGLALILPHPAVHKNLFWAFGSLKCTGNGRKMSNYEAITTHMAYSSA